MKITIAIICGIIGIGLGFGLSIFFTTNTAQQPPVVVSQPMTLTLSIDTHTTSLKTYQDIPVIAGERLLDTLQRLGTQGIIPFDENQGTITLFDLTDSSGNAFWRVYQNGVLAPDQFAVIVNGGEYIELQYESVRQVEGE